jgi:microcystin-dependent protein
MKRQSFMLGNAGALLAGCAAPAMPPSALTAPGMQAAAQHTFDNGSAQLLGSLLLIPYDYVPVHFAPCQGQLLPIQSNPALFSLLGIKFGGDGQTDFELPDMRKHNPIKGLSYAIATKGIYPKRKALEPSYYYGIPPLIGQISCVAYLAKYVPPPSWAKCDGQLLNIDKNIALYSLLGAKFGGDGQTTFALPDLRDHELKKGLTYVIALSGRFPLER